jgi:hypothetical protein
VQKEAVQFIGGYNWPWGVEVRIGRAKPVRGFYVYVIRYVWFYQDLGRRKIRFNRKSCAAFGLKKVLKIGLIVYNVRFFKYEDRFDVNFILKSGEYV